MSSNNNNNHRSKNPRRRRDGGRDSASETTTNKVHSTRNEAAAGGQRVGEPKQRRQEPQQPSQETNRNHDNPWRQRRPRRSQKRPLRLQETNDLNNKSLSNDIEAQLQRQRLQQHRGQQQALLLRQQQQQGQKRQQFLEQRHLHEQDQVDGGGRNDCEEKQQPQQPIRLGNYRYDHKRNAYFPASCVHPSSWDRDGGSPPHTGRTTHFQKGYSWLFARQAESLDHRRRWKLATWGCSHLYWEQMHLTASAVTYRRRLRNTTNSRMDSWELLFGRPPPQSNVLDSSNIATITTTHGVSGTLNDLMGKIHGPAWLRTFDVWTPNPNRNVHQTNGDLDQDPLWQISTAMEDGIQIRSKWGTVERSSPSMQPQHSWDFVPLRSKQPRQLRYLHFSPSSSYLGQRSRGGTSVAILSSRESSSVIEICSLPYPAPLSPSNHEEAVMVQEDPPHLYARFKFNVPANDMVESGTGSSAGILVATAESGGGNNRKNPKTPCYFLSMDQPSRPLHIRNLASSEILRVERAPSSAPQHYYFGHRNGTVTLYDARSPQMAASILTQGSGSITSLLSVGQAQYGENVNGGWGGGGCWANGHLLLTQSQNFSSSNYYSPCSLWDVRKSSQHTTNPVMEFQLPQNAIPRLTQRCNGMAVDPYGTTLFSPYVERHDCQEEQGSQGQEEIPCLGVWSLISGEWIGVKRLAKTPPPSSEDGMPCFLSSSSQAVTWVELCPKRTTAWRWPPRTNHTANDQNNSQTRKKNTNAMDENDDEYHPTCVPGGDASFGLWYKCGQSPVGHLQPGLLLPHEAGSIHHIAIGPPCDDC